MCLLSVGADWAGRNKTKPQVSKVYCEKLTALQRVLPGLELPLPRYIINGPLSTWGTVENFQTTPTQGHSYEYLEFRKKSLQLQDALVPTSFELLRHPQAVLFSNIKGAGEGPVSQNCVESK